jgi:hypothetical protein
MVVGSLPAPFAGGQLLEQTHHFHGKLSRPAFGGFFVKQGSSGSRNRFTKKQARAGRLPALSPTLTALLSIAICRP